MYVLEQRHEADLNLHIKEIKWEVTFWMCLSAQQELVSTTGVADGISLHLTFPIASNGKRLQTSFLRAQSSEKSNNQVRIVIHVKDYKKGN